MFSFFPRPSKDPAPAETLLAPALVTGARVPGGVAPAPLDIQISAAGEQPSAVASSARGAELDDVDDAFLDAFKEGVAAETTANRLATRVESVPAASLAVELQALVRQLRGG